jgi:hypothetical protein
MTNGEDVIGHAVSVAPAKARAKYYERLNGFKDQPQHLWNGKRSKALEGYVGLVEIRFLVGNIQYRPIGFFGPNRNEFTVLVWATEKGDEFVPKNAPSLADDRRKLIEANSQRAHVCNF